MLLTPQNYHSQMSNEHYMSNSQYGNFLQCPACAVAQIKGRWDTGEKEAFLFGGYVDCALLTPLDLPAWWANHQSAMIEVGLLSKAMKTRGAKLAKMIQADAMISRASQDELFMEMLQGQQQQIFTSEIAGVPFRVMLDALNVEKKRIVDLKTTKNAIKSSWFDADTIFDRLNGVQNFHKFKGMFFDEFSYFRQGAVYSRVVGDELKLDTSDWDVYLAVISKHKPTDCNPMLSQDKTVMLRILEMSADRDAMKHEMEMMESNLPIIAKWKNGEEPPPACGECAFCIAVQPSRIEKIHSVIWERR